MKRILFAALAAALLTSCAKEKVEIRGVEDLPGAKIGVQIGTTGETWVQENVPDAKLNAFKTVIDAALDLRNGVIDAIVIDELPAKAIIAKNPDLMILTAGSFAREEYAIAVKKGNPDMLEAINAAIRKARADGTYDKLCASFMPIDGKIVIPDIPAPDGERTLRLGTNAAFPPFEYVEGSEVVGFDISMGRYIAADCGAKLEVMDMAFDSLIPALVSGAIDFIAAGMTATDERRKNVDFSDTYYESEQVIIIRK